VYFQSWQDLQAFDPNIFKRDFVLQESVGQYTLF